MRISDWSSDVCSSDLVDRRYDRNDNNRVDRRYDRNRNGDLDRRWDRNNNNRIDRRDGRYDRNRDGRIDRRYDRNNNNRVRSAEHTSELQSLMRHSYADFRLKKTNLPIHPKQAY